ncbi:MAG: SulP family inorganic anion transporter, partial [Betaproteobacteria bacterium]
LIGLTEATSSARAVAIRSGQRIDGNQEFIGQGLANIVGAFTSSYPTSGSFNRTSANYDAGARTPLAAVASAGFLLGIVMIVAPLAQYLPFAAMAAILFFVAWGLVDIPAIRRVSASGRGELLTLLVTFIATITIRLEVAIFVGVLTSLLVYLHRTTRPRITRVAPDIQSSDRRFVETNEYSRRCPQLDILRVDGSLYFGAVDHVREELEVLRARNTGNRQTLLVGTGINFIDASGAELLEREEREARSRGHILYMCSLKPNVYAVLERSGLLTAIGPDRLFATKAEAIRAIYSRLDSEICATCTVRIFQECQHQLPNGTLRPS